MKFAVMIPTYNEVDSIERLLIAINGIENFDIRILVIDDNSPDKTADFVESLQLKNVDILRRKVKDGLGNAYKAGIAEILKDPEVTHLVSMDADGSHRVEDLLELLKVAKARPDSPLILGSRWVPGGQIVNWPKHRKWLSKLGTKYARAALKLKLNDLTGGFRIYPRWALEEINLEKITSNGYCYQIEMAFALTQLGRKMGREIIEQPITFIEREQGNSKMSQRIVIEAMAQVSRWALTLRLNPTADKLHYVK